ncbi:hypothetical protein CU097_007741 [Rhizopus azygosporus]|uniref:Uncharacterized protein n=1 Tax=Rhizopus azygosporus TaxID=86630 RepID=A0A367JSP4_RHIAZ|nr:hypothetical protein CU097_007741 [Rhizopus azygosporus]
MVKAYLRYEPFAPFGVIASTQSNIVLEEVILWDLEKGTEIARSKESGNKSEMTSIAKSPNNKDYAGTDAEKAVCISTEGYLFSFSKGTLIKLWDLVYYYCCELLMGHHLWWCRTSVEGLQIDWHIMDLSLEELGEQTNNKDEKDATTAASLQKAINPYRNIPNSKRAREKGKDDSQVSEKITPEDDFASEYLIRTPDKVRSFDFSPATNVEKAEAYTIPIAEKKSEESNEPSKLYSLDVPGHRSDIRTLTLSSDDELLASTSNNLLKVWSLKTRTCIRTMECGFALCSALLPGNKYILVRTKTSELALYDIGSSTMIESIKAHDGAVYSLQVRSNKPGFVTGSTDKDVEF